MRRPPRSIRKSNAGFTLVEALVSITIAALASSALYLGIISSLQTSQFSLEQAQANGIAELLLDEAMGNAYVIPGGDPYQAVLCPNAYELAGVHRERFNDIDDYTGLVSAPPKDMYGMTLGSEDGIGGLRHTNFRAPSNFLSNWRAEIDVYYVSESNPMTKVTTAPYSSLRAIEVNIYAVESPSSKRLITSLRRVHGYVPAPP